MKKVYLSIGSNLGDRQANLQQAVNILEEMEAIEVKGISSLYQTAPYGPVEQDDFYNAVLKLETSLEPRELLKVTQAIEIAAKREKTVHWGPRTLDLDIVWFEGVEMDEEDLTIPHKEALNRLFVLYPLKDVFHQEEFLGKPIDDHIQAVSERDPDQKIEKVLTYWLEGYGLSQDAHQTIEKATYDILRAVGEDPERPGLKDTPGRVARMYEEVFSGLIEPPFNDYKLFESDAKNELVVVRDISFYSMCEHHLLPFYGKVHIGYIPNGQVLGLSKFARLVKNCAARPSVQEELTTMIGQRLDAHVPSQGFAIAVEAEHMCMSMRGAKSEESFTRSYYFSGKFAEDQNIKEEFLQAIEGDLK